MKSRLPRTLDLAIKRLAQEQARRFYGEARRQLEREAAAAIAKGVTADAITAQICQRMIRAA